MGEVMNIKQEFKKCVMAGEFLEARKLVDKISLVELDNLLFSIGYDDGSITAYAFACFLLQEHETKQWHLLASGILSTALCHLEGAYQTSLYHARRAIDLCPEDIFLKENLLFFNIIPEKLIADSKAIEIAQEILKVIPDSKAALAALKNK